MDVCVAEDSIEKWVEFCSLPVVLEAESRSLFEVQPSVVLTPLVHWYTTFLPRQLQPITLSVVNGTRYASWRETAWETTLICNEKYHGTWETTGPVYGPVRYGTLPIDRTKPLPLLTYCGTLYGSITLPEPTENQCQSNPSPKKTFSREWFYQYQYKMDPRVSVGCIGTTPPLQVSVHLDEPPSPLA